MKIKWVVLFVNAVKKCHNKFSIPANKCHIKHRLAGIYLTSLRCNGVLPCNRGFYLDFLIKSTAIVVANSIAAIMAIISIMGVESPVFGVVVAGGGGTVGTSGSTGV